MSSILYLSCTLTLVSLVDGLVVRLESLERPRAPVVCYRSVRRFGAVAEKRCFQGIKKQNVALARFAGKLWVKAGTAPIDVIGFGCFSFIAAVAPGSV